MSLQSCAWCPGDSNYVACVAQDSPSVVILDVRRAGRVGASVLADLALPEVSPSGRGMGAKDSRRGAAAGRR